MKTSRFLFLTLFLLLLLGYSAEPAAACSCAEGTPADSAAYADAIFVGEVVEIDEPLLFFSSADPVNVRFAVSETWSPGVTGDLTLQTARDGASCGYTFNVGTTYLVYASSGDGQLSTGLCSGTKPVMDARADLEYLGESMAPAAAATDTSPSRLLLALGVVMAATAALLLLAGGTFLLVRRSRA